MLAGMVSRGSPPVRDRIIEAAEICIRRNGIAQMRMQEVADEARVSMATLAPS
jgi:AcrR family transcriptional regulator